MTQVGVAVGVRVALLLGVVVAVLTGGRVAVLVSVFVGVFVGVLVGVPVAVLTGGRVAVLVGGRVGVLAPEAGPAGRVGVGVGVAPPCTLQPNCKMWSRCRVPGVLHSNWLNAPPACWTPTVAPPPMLGGKAA